jgi:hypothetical protein
MSLWLLILIIVVVALALGSVTAVPNGNAARGSRCEGE